jgi:probable rRNA maturation factor
MIEINNLTKERINKKEFEKISEMVLNGEKNKKAEISLAIVDSRKIKTLNKKYRKKDKATDVLSFQYDVPSLWNKDFLGEIIICPKQVKKNAREMNKVLIHGILHLLGFDHEKNNKEAKIMQKKEDFYLSKIKTK